MALQNTVTSDCLSEQDLNRFKDFWIEIRVRYSDTDMSGYTHHSKYFVWLEEARIALLRELGFSYRSMEEGGIIYPVVEAKCRYLEAVRLDDVVEIHIRVLKANRRFIRLGYTIMTQEEKPKKVAEAETMNIAVDVEGNTISLPGKYLDLLKKIQQIQESQASK